jgi:hypothetical protein
MKEEYIKSFRQVTDVLKKAEETLAHETVLLHTFVAETDPKIYGSNEAQREAALALQFPEIIRLKREIKLLRLELDYLQFAKDLEIATI